MSDLAKFSAVFSVLVLIIFAPFALIWGFNELSEQGGLSFQLPYNFWTWLSSMAIAFVLKGGK